MNNVICRSIFKSRTISRQKALLDALAKMAVVALYLNRDVIMSLKNNCDSMNLSNLDGFPNQVLKL